MLPFTLEQLRELDDEQRAAAIASLAEAIAQRVGLSWDAIVARHRPTPPPDTDWEEMPTVDDDAPWAAHMPWMRGYPGYRRRFRGKLLIVRQRGPAAGLPSGWYGTINGELISGCLWQVLFTNEEEAMQAAEQLVDEMVMENE
jgi:hypothetical protein